MSTVPSRPAANVTADIAYIAVFAALIIVLGLVFIPVGSLGVPIVLQNTAVILTALLLGPRRAFFATGLFLLVSFVFPVLAGGRTIYTALSSPNVGYLVGYLTAALVAGSIAVHVAGKSKAVSTAIFVLAGLAGLVAQYLCGVIGIMVRSGLDLPAALLAQLPLVTTDLLELVAVVAVAIGVHSAFPHLLQREAH